MARVSLISSLRLCAVPSLFAPEKSYVYDGTFERSNIDTVLPLPLLGMEERRRREKRRRRVGEEEEDNDEKAAGWKGTLDSNDIEKKAIATDSATL